MFFPLLRHKHCPKDGQCAHPTTSSIESSAHPTRKVTYELQSESALALACHQARSVGMPSLLNARTSQSSARDQNHTYTTQTSEVAKWGFVIVERKKDALQPAEVHREIEEAERR